MNVGSNAKKPDNSICCDNFNDLWAMQTNIFGEIETYGLTIEQAAKTANVSTATIRNWIKTGYLIQSGNLYKIGYISNEDRYAKNKEENQLLFRIRAKKWYELLNIISK